jgi:hypothetical protein
VSRARRWAGRVGAAVLIFGGGARQPCVAQLPNPTFERRDDLSLSAGVVQVYDSVGTLTLSVLGAELARGDFNGQWAWGPVLRVWVIPQARGVNGASVNALLRASRVAGDDPRLELRGALGIGLSSISVQRGTQMQDRGDIGFVYELGTTYERRFGADAGLLFSLDAVGPTLGLGNPHARFPILTLGVGLRWHRLQGRNIPEPQPPRPWPIPGRRPWPERPES